MALNPSPQPNSFSLDPCYPNPFNPTTTIPFSIPTESNVKIEVFNILGQSVAVLEDGIVQAGNHKVLWDGRNFNGSSVASGVYILKMEAKGTVVDSKFKAVSKLILTK